MNLDRLKRSLLKSKLPVLFGSLITLWTFMLALNYYQLLNCYYCTFKGAKPLDSPSLWKIDVLFSSDIHKIHVLETSNLATSIFKLGLQVAENALDKSRNVGITQSSHNSSHKSGNEIRFEYPPFTVSEPHFINEEDRKFFWKNKLNNEFAQITNKRHLSGVIKLLEGAKYSSSIECGWGTKLEQFMSTLDKGDEGKDRNLTIYCPLLVPESDAFQHFIDGTVPKLLQALPFLLQENVTLVILTYGTNPVIPEILQRLGIKSSSLQIYSFIDRIEDKVVEVDYQLNSCIAPPLHPILVQTFHTLIQAPWTLTAPLNETFVILLNRKLAHNPGRKMLNRVQVESYLRNRYAHRLHIFKGVYDLNRAFNVFGRAAIIIGVHGGAFYNLNFSPQQTVIVEIMPYWENEYPNLSHSIVWRMADALGQQYWRINQQAADLNCNVNVNLTKLERVLDIIDGNVAEN